MRIETLFAAALFTLPALAQMEVTLSGDRGEPATLTFKQGTFPLSTITGYPYSGTDTFETTLANGSHMPALPALSTQVYRDSMGRTRRESTLFIPSTGGNFPVIQILDPVAGYQYVLDSLHQTVHRVAVSVATGPAPKTLRPCRASGHSPASTLKDGATATTEWLGLQVIEGVAACGSRTTLTYPPGSMFGNDRPLNAGGRPGWPRSWAQLC